MKLQFLALCAATLVACGGSSNKAPAASATNGTDQPRPITPQTVPNTSTAAGIHISDEIRAKCGIPEADAYFAYDSSSLRSSDTAILDKVAQCFTTGPLAGQKLALVGRADPRGETQYNMELGHRRADSVGKYLVTKMDKSKVESTSQGSLGATGQDENGWARDRRVDLELAR